VREIIAAVGMKGALAGFDLGAARLAEIVAYAPATRPGRFTVLDRDRPSGADLRGVLEKLL
jgi:hypothetical protein